MGRAYITVPVPGQGKVRISLAQLGAIMRWERLIGPVEWHVNECGCCIAVHPKGQHDRGCVIDADGGEDWVGPLPDVETGLPFPVQLDPALPKGVVRIEAKETHLVKGRADGSAEFVGGPNDGMEVRP